MEKQLTMTGSEARKVYKSIPELRGCLEQTFGKEFFNQNVMERVTSVDDAFSETGRPKITDYSMFPEDMREYIKAHYELAVLHEALNEGRKGDYDDDDERKYYSWWEKSPSGFVFCHSIYDCSYASAGCGVRLCLKSPELVKHSASIAPHLFNAILNK